MWTLTTQQKQDEEELQHTNSALICRSCAGIQKQDPRVWAAVQSEWAQLKTTQNDHKETHNGPKQKHNNLRHTVTTKTYNSTKIRHREEILSHNPPMSQSQFHPTQDQIPTVTTAWEDQHTRLCSQRHRKHESHIQDFLTDSDHWRFWEKCGEKRTRRLGKPTAPVTVRTGFTGHIRRLMLNSLSNIIIWVSLRRDKQPQRHKITVKHDVCCQTCRPQSNTASH